MSAKPKICKLIEKESLLPGTIIVRTIPITTLVPVRIEVTQVLQQLEYSKEYIVEGKYLGVFRDGSPNT